MKGRIVAAVGLSLALMALLVASLSHEPVRAQGSCDRYVLRIDTTDNGDCSNGQQPCHTIQYAIDHSVDGDVICIAKHSLAGPLTYPETLIVTRSVTLDGAWDGMCVDPSGLNCSLTSIPCDPANVTIDAEGAGRVISISGSIAPTIYCLTITGGDASGLGGDPSGSDGGGGIYSRDAAPIIVRNVISGNYGCVSSGCTASGRGGGIYLLNAPATAVISNNLIVANQADKDSTFGEGGGIMLRNSSAQVLSNTISSNRAGTSAGNGGGIAVRGGWPTIADNTIEDNRAGVAMAGAGGGIYVQSDSPVTVEDNYVGWNYALFDLGGPWIAGAGGGLYYHYTGTLSASPLISGNQFDRNMAAGLSTGYGGGAYLSSQAPARVINNQFWQNTAAFQNDGSGGGLYLEDSVATVTDSVFYRNSATWVGSHGDGGAIYADGGQPVIYGSFFLENNGAGFGLPSTSTGYGGAMALSDSQAVVEQNIVASNFATKADGWGGGGGLYAYSGTVQIVDNYIVYNHGSLYNAGLGGGLMITRSVAQVRDNYIWRNVATSDTLGAGGGLYGYGESLILSGNTIMENRAAMVSIGAGGGAYLQDALLQLDGNLIVDNVSAPDVPFGGGGVRIISSPAFTMTNNIIARNHAGGQGSGVAILAGSTGHLAHNTIAENTGGDGNGVRVQSGSGITLTNNIIVSQTLGINNDGAALVQADYTLFEGNAANYGAGVSSSNEVAGPAALNAAYHLRETSNARDHAVSLAWVTRDIDLHPRPMGLASDVGADEYVPDVYLPLIMKNP